MGGRLHQRQPGPHHELQLSLFASARPLPPVQAHPFAIHRALLTQPEVCMACAALWNDIPQVARYNAQHLGLKSGDMVRMVSKSNPGDMSQKAWLGRA